MQLKKGFGRKTFENNTTRVTVTLAGSVAS